MMAYQNNTVLVILIFAVLALLQLMWLPSASALLYRIEEERPAFTFIGNVKDDSNLRKKHSEEVLKSLRFSLHQPSTAANEYLTIDAELGILRSKARIDREQLCLPPTSNCDTLAVDVKVLPLEHIEIIKVRVKIIDINDQKPTFPVARVEWPILENAVIGTSFPLPHAEDADVDRYGVQIYEITTPTIMFDIQITNQTDGTLDAAIVLRNRLDHETQDFYRLVVNAWDGGTPPQQGTLTVDIVVINVNDNNPVFGRDQYEAKVYENAIPGSELLRVHAVDSDSGTFGEVVYSLSPLTASSLGHLFRIDSRTGMIYLKDLLDYEQRRFYELVVVASDRGENSLHTSAKVEIVVLDVNDNAPSIIMNALTDSGHAEIAENVNVGTFVAHMIVLDPDAGPSGQFECTIDSEYFLLDRRVPSVSNGGSINGAGTAPAGIEYKLVSDAIFDREQRDSYEVRMTCADLGEPQQMTYKRFKVKVVDENDNSPVFSERIYHVFYGENNVPGSLVIKLNATDQDIGRNSAIRYEIQSLSGKNDKVILDIDPVSGYVRAQTIFDYEDRHSYEFLLIASDHGEPPRSATATLLLEILDQNDEKPTFIYPEGRNSFTFQVYENRSPNVFVGKVNATDKDSHPYNQINYILDGALSDPGVRDAFELDPTSGVITTKITFDREVIASYRLMIVAANVGFVAIKSSTEVIVQILDENDNAPQILFPSSANQTIQVPTNLGVGSTVATIRAHDPDYSLNGTLTYLMLNPLSATIFDIMPSTGAIVVTGDLSKRDQQIFTLQLAVRDHGIPPWESHAQLTIVVNRTIHYDAPIFGHLLSLTKSEFVVVAAIAAGITVTLCLVIVVACIVRIRRCQLKRNQRYNCRKHEAHVSATGPLNGDTGRRQNGNISNDVKYSKVMMSGEKTNGTLLGNTNRRSSEFEMELMQLAWKDDERGYTKIEVDMSSLEEDKGAPSAFASDMQAKGCTIQQAIDRRSPPKPCLCSSPINCQLSRDRLHTIPATVAEKRASDLIQGADRDSESGCSACTDSGKGPSEEGDFCNLSNNHHQLATSPVPSMSSPRCTQLMDHHPCDVRCPPSQQTCMYSSPTGHCKPTSPITACWPVSAVAVTSSPCWAGPGSPAMCSYRGMPSCCLQDGGAMRTFTPPPLPSPTAFVDWRGSTRSSNSLSPPDASVNTGSDMMATTNKKKGVRFADVSESRVIGSGDSPAHLMPARCLQQKQQQQLQQLLNQPSSSDARLQQWLHTNVSSADNNSNCHYSCSPVEQFGDGMSMSLRGDRQTKQTIDDSLSNITTDV